VEITTSGAVVVDVPGGCYVERQRTSMSGEHNSSDLHRALGLIGERSADGVRLVPRLPTGGGSVVALHIIGDFDKQGIGGRWFRERVEMLWEVGVEQLILSCERFLGRNGHYSLDPLLFKPGHNVVLAAIPHLLLEVLSVTGMRRFVQIASNIEEAATMMSTTAASFDLPRTILCPICESPVEISMSEWCDCPHCTARFVVEESGLLTMRYRSHQRNLPDLLSLGSAIPVQYPMPKAASRPMRHAIHAEVNPDESQNENIEILESAE
jgi:hypothetical protein